MDNHLLFVTPLTFGSGWIRPLSATTGNPVRTTTTLSTPRRPRFTPHASQKSPAPGQENSFATDNAKKYSDSSMDWQEEIRLLLDPTMNVSVKQVLIQDFAKRLPDALKSPCARGIEDVFRQLTEDVIPDLVTNGPHYVSRAVEQVSSRASGSTSTSASAPSFKPPSVGVDDVSRELRNVFNRTPEGLFTPSFNVLVPSSDAKCYEIRQYPTVIIAETDMQPHETTASKNVTEVEAATAMGQGFNTLAGYLFGKNESETEMKMTTPVMLSKGGSNESMSFIIGEYNSVDDVPKTLDDSVKLREEPGTVYAVVEFSGFVTVGEAKRQRDTLMKALEKDGVNVSEHGKENYKCMIYNGPNTLPNLRRNELMIEIEYDIKNNDEQVNEA